MKMWNLKQLLKEQKNNHLNSRVLKDLNKIFEHSIKLADENKPPPKRKLYPLDQDELQELKK